MESVSTFTFERALRIIERQPTRFERAPRIIERHSIEFEREPRTIERQPTEFERAPRIIERLLVDRISSEPSSNAKKCTTPTKERFSASAENPPYHNIIKSVRLPGRFLLSLVKSFKAIKMFAPIGVV